VAILPFWALRMANEVFELSSPMPASADEVYAWHARPAAFLRLHPAWDDLHVVAQKGRFGEDGYTITFFAPVLGPVGKNWVAEAYGFEPGRRFRDRQLHGPFAHWEHTHSMTPAGPDTSALTDHIEFRPPLGAVGRAFGSGIVRDRLRRMFAYRHALTASDLRRHRRHPGRLRVAVTGSRGMVGTDLCQFLNTGGHDVVRFTRGTPPPPPFDDGTRSAAWDPDAPVDPKSLEGVDAVVHLAGENIAGGRWTDGRKTRIVESRTGPTRRLAEAAAKARPKVFVSASAVGIYGDRGDEELDESAPPGGGFLADVCKQWEAATEPAAAAGVRVVHLRIGVVLSPKSGALGKQLPAFQAGAGAVLGGGKQWVSWITVHDLVGAIYHAVMTESLSGPVNAVAPHPVTNREFGRVLAKVLRRPYLMTLPAPALRLMFGEVADAALLASMKVRPRKLTESGFAFDHPHLEDGLRFLLGRPS
jgi:hypothetical protein